MNKLSLLSILYLVFNFSTAQTVIVEEKYEDKMEPLTYYFNTETQLLFIEKGQQQKGISSNDVVKEIYNYDKNGTKKTITKNSNFMRIEFSKSGNTFRATEFESFSFGKNHKYITENKATEYINYKKDKIFKITPFFNDQYEWGISNEKLKQISKVNLQKDKLVLVKTDIYSRKNTKTTIEKPNIERLIGKNYVKPRKKRLGLLLDNPKNYFFEIITKSITKDYKSSTTYRTFYDDDGKKVNEVSYNVLLDKNIMTYSGNNNTQLDHINDITVFDNNLTINGLTQDKRDKSVYIYGLITEKAKKLNMPNKPIGYYLFKFDHKGKLIWKSVKHINNKLFNKNKSLKHSYISLLISENDLLIIHTIGANLNEKENISFNHNKETGTIIKKNDIKSKRAKMLGSIGGLQFEYFLYAFNKIESHKEIAFDAETLIAMNENSKIKNYINSLKDPKVKILFNTIIADKGYWLIEGDNKNYYKIQFFDK